MPAATTHGYPYPVGTDLVVNGDDAIMALATAVDASVFAAPYFKAVHPGGVSLSANATITGWAAQENIGGGSYNAGGYVVPQAGLYRLYMTLKWDSTASTSAMAIHRNGTRVALGGITPVLAYGANFVQTSLRLAKNDTITTQVNVAFKTQSDTPAENSAFIVEFVRA